jgi:hypothetical protein
MRQHDAPFPGTPAPPETICIHAISGFPEPDHGSIQSEPSKQNTNGRSNKARTGSGPLFFWFRPRHRPAGWYPDTPSGRIPLNQSLRDAKPSVALYWDFENLHASLSEARLGEGSYGKPDGRFKTQEPLIDVQAIVDLAASFGPIAINRAYCNWQFFRPLPGPSAAERDGADPAVFHRAHPPRTARTSACAWTPRTTSPVTATSARW